MAVRSSFQKAGLQPLSIELGEVELQKKPTDDELEKLNEDLNKLGFGIIDDKKSRIIEKIKNSIVEHIHHKSDGNLPVNLSDYLARQLHYDYTYLSNLFSEVEGISIEKYFIAQKIEKVKELLKYDELSLSEIADRLGYSSVAYLSNQFKKQTGLSPFFYKNSKKNDRRNLDEL